MTSITSIDLTCVAVGKEAFDKLNQADVRQGRNIPEKLRMLMADVEAAKMMAALAVADDKVVLMVPTAKLSEALVTFKYWIDLESGGRIDPPGFSKQAEQRQQNADLERQNKELVKIVTRVEMLLSIAKLGMEAASAVIDGMQEKIDSLEAELKVANTK